jgi:hypothetical protein
MGNTQRRHCDKYGYFYIFKNLLIIFLFENLNDKISDLKALFV